MGNTFLNLFNKTKTPTNMSFERLLEKAVIAQSHVADDIKYSYLIASGANIRRLAIKDKIKKNIKELKKSGKHAQVSIVAKYLFGFVMDIKLANLTDYKNTISFATCYKYLIDKSGMERNEIIKIITAVKDQLFNDFIEEKLKDLEMEEKILSEEEDLIIKETKGIKVIRNEVNEKVKIIKISDEKDDLNLYCLDCIKNKNNSCKRDNPENCEFSETVKDLIGTSNLKHSPYINKSDYLKSVNIDLKNGSFNENHKKILTVVDYYRINTR